MVSFTYFEGFEESENTDAKKFLPWWWVSSPYRGTIAPIYTKIIYDLIIAIINKYFKF